MRRQRDKVDQGCVVSRIYDCTKNGTRRVRAARCEVLVGLAIGCLVGLTVPTSSFGACENEARRVEQSSTYLPDCRAYELVTPSEKGATQALDLGSGGSNAIPAEGGERFALFTQAYLGDNPGSLGTTAVFSRSDSGWEMTSLQLTGSGETNSRADIFTPDLAQVGVEAYMQPGRGEGHSPTQTFLVGSPGGPYSTVATTSSTEEIEENDNKLVGGSTNFDHVVLSSWDDSLLPTTVGMSDPQAPNLYDWTNNGQLHIVNVTNGGSLVSECGAAVGLGSTSGSVFFGREHNAVSSDGSKIFFTSPLGADVGKTSESGCTSGEEEGGPPPENPHRLYMRVNDNETVEVSAPQLEGTEPCDPGTWSAFYQGASADGSKVFFTTESELTPDHAACRPPGSKNLVPDMELYEYNTNTRKLIRISCGDGHGVPATAEGHVTEKYNESPAVISEDGTAVYFTATGKLTENAVENPSGAFDLYRYDTVSETLQFIALIERPPNGGLEPASTSSDGNFFLFPSSGVLGEPRGENHDELYRYANAENSLMCVSCGPGTGPAPEAGTTRPANQGTLAPGDLTPAYKAMSNDGRFAFFNSTAQLVPRDTNSASKAEEELANPKDQDVYEWEAVGTEEAPGVFCREIDGCTHLITSGNSENTSLLLGVSTDASNVFFETSARLVPQDEDDFPDIYDARINGGFAAPATPIRCAGEACRLIPSASPVISTPLSATFFGAGNITPPVSQPGVKPRPLSRAQKLLRALKACRKAGMKKKRTGCEAQAKKHYGAKTSERGGRAR